MALFDCFKQKPTKIEEVLAPKLPSAPAPELQELDPYLGIYRPITDADLKDYLRAYFRGHPGYGTDVVLPVKVARCLAKYFDKVKEIPGKQNNPLIVAWHGLTHYGAAPDEVMWCASGMGGCLIWAGFPSTNSAGAVSYAKYAQENKDDWVEEGDEIYMKHPGGHVTFANKRFNRRTDTTYEGFGANQNNSMCAKIFFTKDIVSVRRAIPKASAPALVRKSGWNYDAFARKALRELGGDLLTKLPADLAEYQYVSNPAEDMVEFYNCLMAALCQFESNYKPEVTYKEDMVDAKGNQVISRGLLQLSMESANSYGGGITNEQQLHDPETNIRCAVLIMKKCIVRDGRIQGGETGAWKGMARYWSPFRKPERIAAIKARMKAATKP